MLALLPLLALPPPPATQADWPEVDGTAARSRYVPMSPAGPLRPEWSRATRVGEGRLVASGDTVYAVGSGGLTALAMRDGSVRWSRRTRLPVSAFVATPQGIIYTDPDTAQLVYRSAHSGRTRFARTADSALPHVLGAYLLYLARSSDESGNPGAVAWVSLRSGALRSIRRMNFGAWTAGNPSTAFSPACFASLPTVGLPSLLAWDGSTIATFAYGPKGRIRGLLYSPLMHGSVAAAPGSVFTIRLPEIGGGLRPLLSCLDARLRSRWVASLPERIDFSAHVEEVAQPCANDVLIVSRNRVVVDNGGSIYAFRRRDGRLAWSVRRHRGWPGYYTAIGAGRLVYMTEASHGSTPADSITAVSLKTGARLWSRRIGGDLQHVICAGGAFYVVDKAGVRGQTGWRVIKLVGSAGFRARGGIASARRGTGRRR